MKYEKRWWTGLGGAWVVAAVLTSQAASAQSSGEIGETAGTLSLQYGIESGFHSRYVFRGIAYSEGPVVQTTAWAELGKLSGYVWGNALLVAEIESKPLSEVDFGLSYGFEAGEWTLTPAYDRYNYRLRPGFDDTPTSEVSLSIHRAVSALDVLSKHVLDVSDGGGGYFGDVQVGAERQVSPRLSLRGTGIVSWASSRYHDAYFGLSLAGMSYVGFRLNLSYDAFENIYIGLELELTALAPSLGRMVETPNLSRFAVTIGYGS